MAKELLYTEKDKKLFLIVGYDNPMEVDELIKTLENGKKKLLACLPNDTKVVVRTEMITESRRYKHMRVFFVEVEPELVPNNAFFIEIKKEYNGEKLTVDSPYQWDMWKWLKG